MSSILSKVIKIFKENWLLLPIILVAITLLIWTSPKFVRMHDEGMLASAAMGITLGKVLYRDVFEFWTPLSVYLTAGVFTIFGYSLIALRTLAAVLLILNTICIYYLLHQIKPNNLFKLLGCAIFIVITYSFAEMNHHWLGMLFLLSTIISLSWLLKSQSKLWAINCGIAAGLAFISMQLEGAVAISLCAITLVAWISPLSKKNIEIWLLLGMGLSIPIVVTVAYFYLQGALGHLFYSTFIFPLTQYRGVNGALAGVSQFALLILVVLVSRFWLKHVANNAAKIWLIATLLMLSCALFTSNSTVANRYAFFPVIVLLGYLLWSVLKWETISSLYRGLRGPYGYIRFLWLVLIVVLVLIGNASSASRAIAAWVNIAKANSLINSPAGQMYARPEVAQKAQTIIDYTLRNTDAGDQVYFGPFAAHYQFITNKPSPLKYSQLTPSYNPEWMFDDAIHEIKTQNIKLVVFLPQENPFEFTQNNQLSTYIKKDYRRVKPLPFSSLLSSESLFASVYARQARNTPQDAIWQLKEK